MKRLNGCFFYVKESSDLGNNNFVSSKLIELTKVPPGVQQFVDSYLNDSICSYGLREMMINGNHAYTILIEFN